MYEWNKKFTVKWQNYGAYELFLLIQYFFLNFELKGLSWAGDNLTSNKSFELWKYA